MATDAEKVKMYREKAKDTSIPQEVRNTYLDRANELERKAYEDSKAPIPAAPQLSCLKAVLLRSLWLKIHLLNIWSFLTKENLKG